MWIMTNRGLPWTSTVSTGITVFLLFYLLHVFMELSGANRQSDKVTDSKVIKWGTIIMVSLILLISLTVHDFTPSFGLIFVEMLVISVSGALLEVFKAYNRGHTDHLTKFINMFLLFAASHLIFQFGGVYSKISYR